MVIALSTVVRYVGLGAALVALVHETLLLRAPGTVPIATLVRRELRAPPGSALAIVIGLVAGGLLVTGPVAWDVALGNATLDRAPEWQQASVVAVVATVMVKLLWVVFEELAFRAALVTSLARRLATPLAVAASAIAFAAAHGRDGGSTAILVVDGIAYATAYVATRSLLAPIAWHAGKNLAVWLLTQSTMQRAPSPWRLTTTGSTSVIGAIAFTGAVVTVAAWLFLRQRHGEPLPGRPEPLRLHAPGGVSQLHERLRHALHERRRPADVDVRIERRSRGRLREHVRVDAAGEPRPPGRLGARE